METVLDSLRIKWNFSWTFTFTQNNSFQLHFQLPPRRNLNKVINALVTSKGLESHLIIAPYGTNLTSTTQSCLCWCDLLFSWDLITALLSAYHINTMSSVICDSWILHAVQTKEWVHAQLFWKWSNNYEVKICWVIVKDLSRKSTNIFTKSARLKSPATTVRTWSHLWTDGADLALIKHFVKLCRWICTEKKQ